MMIRTKSNRDPQNAPRAARGRIALLLAAFMTLTVTALFPLGCGGSSSSGQHTTATRATGGLHITITWPQTAASRVIPTNAQSIKIQLLDSGGNDVLKNLSGAIVTRPSGGYPTAGTTVDFVVAVGSYTLAASAWTGSNGDGTLLASGQVPISVQAGATTTPTLTLSTSLSKFNIARYNDTSGSVITDTPESNAIVLAATGYQKPVTTTTQSSDTFNTSAAGTLPAGLTITNQTTATTPVNVPYAAAFLAQATDSGGASVIDGTQVTWTISDSTKVELYYPKGSDKSVVIAVGREATGLQTGGQPKTVTLTATYGTGVGGSATSSKNTVSLEVMPTITDLTIASGHAAVALDQGATATVNATLYGEIASSSDTIAFAAIATRSGNNVSAALTGFTKNASTGIVSTSASGVAVLSGQSPASLSTTTATTAVSTTFTAPTVTAFSLQNAYKTEKADDPYRITVIVTEPGVGRSTATLSTAATVNSVALTVVPASLGLQTAYQANSTASLPSTGTITGSNGLKLTGVVSAYSTVTWSYPSNSSSVTYDSVNKLYVFTTPYRAGDNSVTVVSDADTSKSGIATVSVSSGTVGLTIH